MKRHGPWRTLGIDPTDDVGAVRRAYADKLRALDIDRDVDGYTKLRNARDNALRLARSAAQSAAAGEPADVRTDDGYGPGEWDEFDDDWEDAPGSDFPGAVAVVEREPPPSDDALAPAEPTEPAPPQVLMELLFPHREISEEAMTPDEWERAQPAFAAILHDAENAPIDRQAGIEDWLAHHLASAWPRSAWLVEDAAAAFGWLGESGQLNERPAVRFLNQRLKGMRFIDKVSQPGHPLHKAWSELSRPGRRGPFGFVRASKGDVQQLLAGIRERFPEVERHLDPERVASWEGAAEITPSSAWGPGRIILVISGIALLRLCMYVADSAPTTEPPPIAIGVAWSAEQVDALVIELFGERLDNDTLRDKTPDLWINIDRASDRRGDNKDFVEDTGKELLMQLRGHTQFAATTAPFEELLAIKQVKLELLRIARDEGGVADCLDFESQGLFPTNIDVPEALRVRERALAVRLAAAGLLQPNDATFPETAAIEGPMIEQVMNSTSLSEETVRQAVRGEGSDEALCNVRIALLEAVLRRPADVSADLLRIS